MNQTLSGKPGTVHFISQAQVTEKTDLIRGFLAQVTAIERDGREVEKTAKDELTLPDDLLKVFSTDPDYAIAFDRLTPGRQRSYIIHFNAAKKPETRSNRISNSRDKVLKGKGQLER